MRVVKTIQRYQCDFCKKRSVKHVIQKHEKRCFRNPNRYCDYCENKGFTMESIDGAEHYGLQKVDCPYCRQFDKQQLEEIEKRESLTP